MEKVRFTDLRQKNIGHLGDKNNELQDILTALPHRHRMEQQLKHRYQQFELGNSYFCVVVADLDNCKAINDHYGRAVGDQALKKLSQFLRQELREDDLVGRWSGNQFILILPNISQKSAAIIAERIRLKARQIELFSQGDQIKFSLSIGVCSTENSTGLDDLLSVAENCVYQAKQMGRNLVISA
jgi:diguanylate cyclase (GGDEF)-like protein